MNERLSQSEWHGVEGDIETVGEMLSDLNQEWFASELEAYGGVTREYQHEREAVLQTIDDTIQYLAGLRACVEEGLFDDEVS